MTEIRQDRFNRVATNRTLKVLDSIFSLSKCSEKKNYCYNREQVKEIFSLIDRALKQAKVSFTVTGRGELAREILNSKLQLLNNRRRENEL